MTAVSFLHTGTIQKCIRREPGSLPVKESSVSPCLQVAQILVTYGAAYGKAGEAEKMREVARSRTRKKVEQASYLL